MGEKDERSEEEAALLKNLEKLAPFVRRAGLAVTGREKLARMGGGKIRLILCARDLAENSLREMQEGCGRTIPIFQALNSGDFLQLYGLENTKIFGLKTSSLADKVAEALEPWRVRRNAADG